MSSDLIDPALFEQLKTKIDEESTIRQELGKIVDELEKNISFTQGLLSRVHSTPRSQCESPMKLPDLRMGN